MGAISKSEPMFTKFNTHLSRLNLVRHAKFRENRKRLWYTIYIKSDENNLGAISKSEIEIYIIKSDENIYGSYI